MSDLINVSGYSLFFSIEGLNVDQETKALLAVQKLEPLTSGILLRPKVQCYVPKTKTVWKLFTYDRQFKDAFHGKEIHITNEYGIFFTMAVDVPHYSKLASVMVITL